jgi:hypothetical protein
MDAERNFDFVARCHLNFVLLLKRHLLIVGTFGVIIMLQMDPSLPLCAKMAHEIKSVLIVMNHFTWLDGLSIWSEHNRFRSVHSFFLQILIFWLNFGLIFILNLNFQSFSFHIGDFWSLGIRVTGVIDTELIHTINSDPFLISEFDS